MGAKRVFSGHNLTLIRGYPCIWVLHASGFVQKGDEIEHGIQSVIMDINQVRYPCAMPLLMEIRFQSKGTARYSTHMVSQSHLGNVLHPWDAFCAILATLLYILYSPSWHIRNENKSKARRFLRQSASPHAWVKVAKKKAPRPRSLLSL